MPPPTRSRAHRRRLYRHSAGPLHEIELERDSFRGAVFVWFGADTCHAVAQAPLLRTQGLPFETINRIAGRVAMRDHAAGEPLTPIVVVALAAREVQLTFAAMKQLIAQVGGGSQLCVDPCRDR